MTDEEWEEEKKRRQQVWALIVKLKDRAAFWHGKWSIVCHENNVLRKKLRDIQEQIKKST